MHRLYGLQAHKPLELDIRTIISTNLTSPRFSQLPFWPMSLLHSSRASSCEQELCDPITLSLALRSEIGSQDPCSARHAAPALQHFMLLWFTLGVNPTQNIYVVGWDFRPHVFRSIHRYHMFVSWNSWRKVSVSSHMYMTGYIQSSHSFHTHSPYCGLHSQHHLAIHILDF